MQLCIQRIGALKSNSLESHLCICVCLCVCFNACEAINVTFGDVSMCVLLSKIKQATQCLHIRFHNCLNRSKDGVIVKKHTELLKCDSFYNESRDKLAKQKTLTSIF